MDRRRRAAGRPTAGEYIAGRTWLAPPGYCSNRTTPAGLVAGRATCVLWRLPWSLVAWNESWWGWPWLAPVLRVTVLAMQTRQRVFRGPRGGASVSCLEEVSGRSYIDAWKLRRVHTVVSLSNAILDATALGQIGDLGPVLVRVGIRTKGTAIAVGRARARTGIIRAMHGE